MLARDRIFRLSPLRSVLLVAALAAALASCGSSDPVADVRDLQAQGRFDESLEPARALTEASPGNPEVLYLYGRALVRTRQMSLAQFPLRKAMESPDWLVPAGLELAGAELATDNAESAIEATSRILEAQPEHLEALLLRSRARAQDRRHYDEALADADRALEVDPGNFEAMMLRVVSLLGLERVEDAEKGLAELETAARDTDSASDIGRVCGMRALLTKEKGDREGAERLFDECLAAHPADATVIQEAIKFFDEGRKPERVVEILRKALAEAPSSSSVRRALADRLRARGEAAESERVLREGTELGTPGLAQEAWVDLGNHFHALGDDAAAATALERAVEIGGAQTDPQLRFDYADALVMAERYDEALAAARELTVPAQRALVEGRVALEQGRAAEALAHFDEGLRLWPDNPVARYYAALAAEAVGDFDRAAAELRYSIRAGVATTDARLRLARLHLAEGADDLAVAVAMHDIDRSPAAFENHLVGIRAAARGGQRPALKAGLARFKDRPVERARVLAAAAEGIRERRDAAAAVRLLRGAEGLDLTDPAQADALRVLVACLAEAGDAAGALEAAKAALATHPDAAVLHAIHGQALAAGGASNDSVRTAYARALELDADLAEALLGLARVAAASGDAAAALDLYAKAAAADPENAEPLRASAELLVAQGQAQQAEARLAQALARNPYDGRAAAQLAALLLERGAELDRALALAKAAARFGGGSEAQRLLARVHERRGEPELAKAAAEKAARPPAAKPPAQPEPQEAAEPMEAP
jgi:tetratricopeptide (TPR) repeat protein